MKRYHLVRPDDDFFEALGEYLRASTRTTERWVMEPLYDKAFVAFECMPWIYRVEWRVRLWWWFLPSRMHLRAHEWRTLQASRASGAE